MNSWESIFWVCEIKHAATNKEGLQGFGLGLRLQAASLADLFLIKIFLNIGDEPHTPDPIPQAWGATESDGE